MKRSKLTLKIAAMFVVVMFASFIPDNFHSFFGDWECQGGGSYFSTTIGDYGNKYYGCQYGMGNHGPSWHYGFRHWIWIAMGIVLFIVNAAFTISEAEAEEKK